MQRFNSTFAFVFFAVVLQLTPTLAGSSSIIARVHLNREGSITTFGNGIQVDTDLYNSNLELNEQPKEAVAQHANNDRNRNNNERKLDHTFEYEPKPNYKSYQPKSVMTKGQKIGLFSMLGLTIALAIYSCVLRYELSTLNVYSLLGVHTATEEDDEEKVGDAYGRRVEMI